MKAHKFISYSTLLICLLSVGHARANQSCAALFSEDSFVQEVKSAEEKEADARIHGYELAADITEAIRSNPAGFSHRNVEKAIIDNLGDLSGQASKYLEKTNLWTKSTDLQVSMDELSHALADFSDAAKRYKKLSDPGMLDKLKGFFDKEGPKKRRLADLIESIRGSRHRVRTTRRRLNKVMDEFEKLKVKFSKHVVIMEDSLDVIKNAIIAIDLEPLLTPDQRSEAHFQLTRFLDSVAGSIANCGLSLAMLKEQYTQTDHMIKLNEGQINTIIDSMAVKGISQDVFKEPFFSKDLIDKNPNIRPDIVTIFFSGNTPEQINNHLYDLIIKSNDQKLNPDEMLIILKLMPRGSASRSAWTEILKDMNQQQANGEFVYGQRWEDQKDYRSSDILILYELEKRFVPSTSHQPVHIDKAEFERVRDYIDDVLDASVSFQKDGLSNKFRHSVKQFILDRSDQLISNIDQSIK